MTRARREALREAHASDRPAVGSGRRGYRRRRVLRHLALAGVSLVLGAAIYLSVRPISTAFRLSMATAYPALLFLALSLLLGPWNVLRGRANPVSTDLRRDVGIWAGILGLLHVLFGLQVHMRGRFWTYFVWGPEQPHRIPVRYDFFGLANHLGLLATLVLALLLALSNDLSLRRLGPGRWKSLQRWNYVGFGLVVLHTAAYQWMEKRAPLFVALAAGIVLLVIGLQAAGFRRVRAENRSRPQKRRAGGKPPSGPA